MEHSHFRHSNLNGYACKICTNDLTFITNIKYFCSYDIIVKSAFYITVSSYMYIPLTSQFIAHMEIPV